MRTAYDLIYDQMFITYGFDRSFAINQFCTKYCVDNVSVIDCVADSPIYQQYFISTVNKLVSDVSDNCTVADNPKKYSADKFVFVVSDEFNYVIHTLANKLQQTISRTKRHVYSAMNTDLCWQIVMNHRHFKYKKEVIEKCDDYKKKFINVCNKMMSETD